MNKLLNNIFAPEMAFRSEVNWEKTVLNHRSNLYYWRKLSLFYLKKGFFYNYLLFLKRFLKSIIK